jgi:hypothetical protein
MTPQIKAFIDRWMPSGARERGNSMFLTELCELLGVPRPDPASPTSNDYVFERPVKFTQADGTTRDGRIDLYKRGCFVLEGKQGVGKDQATGGPVGHGRRLSAGWDVAMMRAKAQAEGYARALPPEEGWPPFILVVDIGFSIEVYADFSRMGKAYTAFPDASCHRILMKDLERAEIRERLCAIWTDPMSLDPAAKAARVTRQVATTLAQLALSLEASGFSSKDIFDFLMRAIFTMFAEDVGLLPKGCFTKLLKEVEAKPTIFQEMVESLWTSMNEGGFSPILREKLLRFNGGLFEHPTGLPLTKEQIQILSSAAKHDWQDVEPAIFGTLVERALSSKDRHKLGAHYTPRAYVERLVMPTIIEPLREEWEAVKVEVQTLRDAPAPKAKKKGDVVISPAAKVLLAFLRKLCEVKVLDPACGSGNFLYVTLEHMKRLEAEVQQALVAFGYTQTGLELEGVTVSPRQFLGIEVNPRAAAIADLVLWLGYLQWHARTHGGAHPKEPVIERFHAIENRDALIAWTKRRPLMDAAGRAVTRWDGETKKPHPATGELVPDESFQVPVEEILGARKTTWPKADFIVGNPPFIGASTMRQSLGDGYVDAVRGAYPELPESIDFVMYWWHLAAELVREQKVRRFGFITTNSIRQTFNRRAMAPQLDAGLRLAFVVPDHPWVDAADGAAVRIAMTVGTVEQVPGLLLRSRSEAETHSDEIRVEFSESVGEVHADLTVGADVTGVVGLRANEGLACPGVKLHGAGFIVSPEDAEKLLPGVTRNARGVPAVIKPYRNGKDMNDRPRGAMVIDLFGFTAEQVLERVPSVYQWVAERVRPERLLNNRATYRDNWWIFGEARRELRQMLAGLPRYIATTETSKHRMFQFLDGGILPDNMLVCMALDDAFHLGVLSSRAHVSWALAVGGTLEDRPRYNKTRCFDPFPFPQVTSAEADKIRQIAEHLDAHRKRQQDLHEAVTMTGMYNVLEALREGRALTPKERVIHEKGLVGILRELHDELDEAVFAAYGWSSSIGNDELLQKLADLNAARAAEEAAGTIRWLRPDFQVNRVAEQPIQHGLGIEDAGIPTTTKPGSNLLPWPESIRERVQVVRTAMAFLGQGVTAESLAKRFKGAKSADVETLLWAMCELGQVHELEGRFAA